MDKPDEMVRLCEHLIDGLKLAVRQEACNGIVAQSHLLVLNYALAKLKQPLAPDNVRECATLLANMESGDVSPRITANTLKELGELALLGLKYREH